MRKRTTRSHSKPTQFDSITNATGPMKEISKRAKDGLKRIGQESAMNARRVRRYGIEVNSCEPKSENGKGGT
jgi:hypothetical protein